MIVAVGSVVMLMIGRFLPAKQRQRCIQTFAGFLKMVCRMAKLLAHGSITIVFGALGPFFQFQSVFDVVGNKVREQDC